MAIVQQTIFTFSFSLNAASLPALLENRRVQLDVALARLPAI